MDVFLQHPTFKLWLELVRDRGFAHGAKLCELFAKVCIDNVSVADQTLEAAERAGLIVRDAKPAPTSSQVWFGVGGSPPGVRKSWGMPCEYVWRPAQTGV